METHTEEIKAKVFTNVAGFFFAIHIFFRLGLEFDFLQKDKITRQTDY